jgi:hypothetical protein
MHASAIYVYMWLNKSPEIRNCSIYNKTARRGRKYTERKRAATFTPPDPEPRLHACARNLIEQF